MGKHRIKPNYPRRVLRLPDLDHCKLAVLNSLGSPASRRVYEYAIDQFIAWYCSEPRLTFNRIVVVRYRMYLESRGLAANTINQQLAAVRRLAHGAADSGLLSPELDTMSLSESGGSLWYFPSSFLVVPSAASWYLGLHSLTCTRDCWRLGHCRFGL
jgi:hypothetical protein